MFLVGRWYRKRRRYKRGVRNGGFLEDMERRRHRSGSCIEVRAPVVEGFGEDWIVKHVPGRCFDDIGCSFLFIVRGSISL